MKALLFDGRGLRLERIRLLIEDGRHEDLPGSWHRGYLDSVDWQWIEGAVTRPGSAVVWMRPTGTPSMAARSERSATARTAMPTRV